MTLCSLSLGGESSLERGETMVGTSIKIDNDYWHSAFADEVF